MNHYQLLLLFYIFSLPLQAQNSSIHECGSDILKKKYTQYYQPHKGKPNLKTSVDDTTLFTLPVTFHVVHQEGNENIPDKDIMDALALLNDGFENVSPFDPARGKDVRIAFCLAAENGITRHASPLTNVTMETDDESLKQIGVQSPTSVINIWIVNSIASTNMGDGVAGYAMFPVMHGSPVDGIVVEAAFMKDDPDAVKVLIHEMGHYLGLYHTFEGGDKNGNCLIDGDKVCDTPPDASTASVPCHLSVNTGISDEDDTSTANPFRAVSLGGIGDQPDMHQNYMDYGLQVCQNTFTQGQKERMRSELMNYRSSLLNNPTACQTCTKPITVSLDLPDTLSAGVEYAYTLSEADSVHNVVWFIDNDIDIVEPEETVFTTIQEEKQVIVRVIAFNDQPACSIELYDTLVFTCDIDTPIISASPDGLVSQGETIDFSVQGSNNYEWFVDGIFQENAPNYSYDVNDEYGRLVTVIADNGTCSVRSEPYFIDPSNCNDSKENNVWYFGHRAGIDFNYNPPKAIRGKLIVDEGCAVICDVDGTPLFHATGSGVGNSQTGVAVENGFPLSGNSTTTQGALFAPQPGNDRYIYLFTLDYQAGEFETGYGGGIHYSIIDKQGDGGNGEVIERNHLMIAPVVEKVTSVINQRGDGIWIIAHEWDSNKFYAWELTSAGLASPVVSAVGVVHTTMAEHIGRFTLGEMKSSPTGKKIALAIDGMGLYQVFNFDKATGQLSNPLTLKNEYTGGAYGVTFSPNEKYIYGSSNSNFIRFNISLEGEEAINNSMEVFPPVKGAGIKSVQLAPDGKVYLIDQSNHLSVVSNPNAANIADCNFEPGSFKLYPNTWTKSGLPNPVKSALNTVRPIIYGTDQVCLPQSSDTTIQYTITPKGRADYYWYHKGENILNQINDSTVSITFSQSTIDTLIAERVAPCGSLYDTLYITSAPATPFSIGNDTTICEDSIFVLSTDVALKNYWWTGSFQNNTLSRDSSITTSQAGYYKLRGESYSGCFYEDSIEVTFYEVPELNLGRDTSICGAEILTLSAPSGLDSYSWTTGETTASIDVASQGTYGVSVSKHSCLFQDEITVWKGTQDDFLEEDYARNCLLSPDTIWAKEGMDSYLWKTPTGDTYSGRAIAFLDTGYYVLTAENRCGISRDSLYYYELKNIKTDTIITCEDSLQFVSEFPFQYFQLPYDTQFMDTDQYYKTNGDTVKVYKTSDYIMISLYPDVIKGDACLILDEVYIALDTSLTMPNKTIDLGGDTSYCEGGVFPLNAGTGFDSYHWNTGSRDSSTTVYGEGEYFVEATYCGFTFTDTIIIVQDEAQHVDLGADKVLCTSENLILDAGIYDWYEWNTGETTQQITVSTTGKYAVLAGNGGCISRDTIVIADGNTPLTISGDSLICEAEEMVLKTQSYVGMNYVWDSLGVETAGSDSLVISSPGTYRVKNQSCIGSTWSDAKEIALEVINTPELSYSPDSACIGKNITISFDESPYKSFEWQDGNNENPRTFEVRTSILLLLNGAKCQQSINVTTPVKHNNCAGGGGNFCVNTFYLAPNPSDDEVSLGSTCELKDEILEIQIVQIEGKFLLKKQGTLDEINTLLNQVVSSVSSAMYILKITSDGETSIIKWIVNH